VLQAVGVIPARYRSVRFPGKVLADLEGRTLIEHVYRRSEQASSLSRLLVAADDERICAAVRSFGGEAIMTRREHASGTERIAEVAAGLDAPLVVNIQGDEPLVDPEDIDGLVEALRADAGVGMATLKRPIEDPEDFRSPHVVKVVVNRAGEALYFSRSPIPFPRSDAGPMGFRHVGLYAYRRDLLLRIAASPRTWLESTEELEQLRVLELGFAIRVLDARGDSIGVDVPEDLERVRARLTRSAR
jgi:3-deoxy-manno-octulosonate cytidylyltransferase (CMP-KDO synthetase)